MVQSFISTLPRVIVLTLLQAHYQAKSLYDSPLLFCRTAGPSVGRSAVLWVVKQLQEHFVSPQPGIEAVSDLEDVLLIQSPTTLSAHLLPYHIQLPVASRPYDKPVVQGRCPHASWFAHAKPR